MFCGGGGHIGFRTIRTKEQSWWVTPVLTVVSHCVTSCVVCVNVQEPGQSMSVTEQLKYDNERLKLALTQRSNVTFTSTLSQFIYTVLLTCFVCLCNSTDSWNYKLSAVTVTCCLVQAMLRSGNKTCRYCETTTHVWRVLCKRATPMLTSGKFSSQHTRKRIVEWKQRLLSNHTCFMS